MSRRAEVEALLARARAERAALLQRVSPALAASLPVDATGITQGIDLLATAAGIDAELRRERDRAHRANPAVLHGRVFGREPLSPDTITAAFAEGARVRDGQLMRLADAVGAHDDVRALLDAAPATLEDTYAAHEGALLLLAGRLDELE